MGPRIRSFTRARPGRATARPPRRRVAPTADPLVVLAFAVGLVAGLAVAAQSDVVTQLGALLGGVSDAR